MMLEILNPIPFPAMALVIAFLMDMVLGDPEGLSHPVRWIGRLITILERALRPPGGSPARERALGAALAASTVGVTYGLSMLALYLSYRYSTVLFWAVSVYMVWTSLAVRSLLLEARSVAKALRRDGLKAARARLSRIVGRDTGRLDEAGVVRAAVETVSENTSDGIVAPLFYLALGGPAMMMAYKAVNTLDSMVGYKNERYLYFGWASARLDDAANFIPARATAVLMVCTSFILRYNWKGSWRALLRDGGNHPSPNSGLPEAAVAGALGLKLGGPMYYGGVLHEKPYIGEGDPAPRPGALDGALHIMLLTAIAWTIAVFLFRLSLFPAI